MIKVSFMLLALSALPVHAGEHMLTSEDCTHYLTLQMRGCQVSQYFQCKGPYAGTQLREDYGINGKTYEAMTDSEARWMRTYAYATGTYSELVTPELDAASLSDLITNKRDSYDFTTKTAEGVIDHYRGEDRLTGETVLIDGQTLMRTEFSFVQTDDQGNEVLRATGREYVHPEFGQFIAGISTYEDENGSYPYDSSPKDFIFPGEPAFDSTIPQYECRDMMSALDLLREDQG